MPEGRNSPRSKELMNPTVAVTSLPGKYNASNANTEGTVMMEQFAEAVGDLTECHVHRNTQWRLSVKNALNKIKTTDNLQNATKEISSMMATVLSNKEACFLEILYNTGWTTADANLWITAGLLPRMI
jgi:hypothetical protein